MLSQNIAAESSERNGAQLGDVLPSKPTGLSTKLEIVDDQNVIAVSFSVLESSRSLTKSFRVGDRGAIEKIGSGAFAHGTATRVDIKGSDAGDVLRQFARCVVALTSYQAITTGAPPSGKDQWEIAASADLDQCPGAISRSRKHFCATLGPALLAIDFDTRTYTPELRAAIAKVGDLTAALSAVFPEFQGAASLRRSSTSSGVASLATNERMTDSGQHRYFVVADGLDAADFAQRLHERFVLNGFGFGVVRKTGYVDICSPIDRNASAPERIVYEANAELGEGLVYLPRSREPIIVGGGLLDTRALPSLTEAERDRLAVISRNIRGALQDEAAAQEDIWIEERVRERVAKGESADAVRRSLNRAVRHHELAGAIEINLDDGTAVTVEEILADPAAFDGETCADPLEPEYGGGRNIAIIYTNGHSRPIIHSQAHGGIRYALWPDLLRFYEALGSETEPHEQREALEARTWPEPADIFGDDAQAAPADFPTHALPTTLEAWAISEARRKGVSTAFSAAAGLAAISAAVGASLRIKPRRLDSWSEPAGVWVVLVAEPGSGKSPIISAALAPLRDLDKRHSAADRKRHMEWAQLAKRAARKTEAPMAVPREPAIRRYVIDDITAESFIRIAADNPRGLMRASDEWASIMGAIGAYKRQGDGDRGMMLRTFDGGEISVDRVGTGNLRADTALQSILAGSQPDKIGKALSDLTADGMAQRTLFVLSDDNRRAGIDELPDATAQAQYRAVVQGLASAEYIFDEPITLTPEGYAACRQAQEQISLIGRYPGSPAALRGHLEKWEKILFRIILALHAFEEFVARGCAATGVPVPLERVHRCIEIARFFIRHQVAFYDRFFGPDQTASEARWIAGHLLTKPEVVRLTHRTIYDARKALVGSDNSMRRQRAAIMNELVDAGWCGVESWKDGTPDSWSVNPGIHSRFADRAERERQQRAARQQEIVNAGRARREWLNSDSLSQSEGE